MQLISRIAAAVWHPGFKFNTIARRVGSFPGSTGPITIVRHTGLRRNPVPGSIGRFTDLFNPNGISGNITAGQEILRLETNSAPGSP